MIPNYANLPIGTVVSYMTKRAVILRRWTAPFSGTAFYAINYLDQPEAPRPLRAQPNPDANGFVCHAGIWAWAFEGEQILAPAEPDDNEPIE